MDVYVVALVIPVLHFDAFKWEVKGGLVFWAVEAADC